MSDIELRPCVSCGNMVTERATPPYVDCKPTCALAEEWRRQDKEREAARFGGIKQLTSPEHAQLERVYRIIRTLHNDERGDWGSPLNGCLDVLLKLIAATRPR